jgi:hypothetical protein
MKAPLVARILGVLFLIAGIAGFLPWPQVATPAPFDAPYITLDQFYRFIGGIFAVNAVHDGVHIAFGLLGLLAGINFKAARIYCKFVVWIYLVLIVLGLIPITSTLFGIAPLYGWDIALHAIVLLIAAYGGYGAASRKDEEPLVMAR